MPFSESVKQAAFKRSGGQCECERAGHSHAGRCTAPVSRLTAEFHHITAESAGGSDFLSNCEVLCIPCHQATTSYGRH